MWRRLRLGQRRRRSRGHSMRRYRRSMRRRRRSARRRRRSRRVSGEIGDCGVGITLQMCNRVTNHGDKSTFSKPAFRMEFSMGSLSRRYRGSLRRHCQFLWSYRRSLRRYRRSLQHCCDPLGDRRLRGGRCLLLRDLLNIKHC